MTADSLTPDERVGMTLCDKWRLERLLGRGGMASVYLARHEIGRYDAIKILHERFADDHAVRARFEREARAVNHFRHAGAVEIRDIDKTADGSPFLVMEYLEGEPLQARLDRGLIGVDALLDIVIDVLDVLGAAHDQRIIHRDIKPANLFLLDDGRVKVLDFGIARMKVAPGEGNLTEEGVMLGTTGYMPPEQIMGGDIDHRADLFALGAMMFRIVSGRPVHRGPSGSEMLVKMATEPAPPLREVAPRAPLGLCQIVDLSLAFDPEARYPDARCMQHDIRSVRQGDPPPYAAALAAGDVAAAEIARRAARAGGTDSAPRARPRPSAAARMTGRVIQGRYRLDRLIGKGGMGAVYEARDTTTDTRVALKLVLSHLASDDSSTPGRFRREARAAASIDSPHAVRVIDADVDDDGTPFLVMELLEGRDLERWLGQVRPISQVAGLQIFTQACRGLAAAHQRRIVHRDIKPANLFLSRQPGGSLVVKVLDFGLAKQRAQDGHSSHGSLTESGGMLGTPRYASPEQVKNVKLVDSRSDVWSLSMTMYEVLSGQVPWSECEAMGEIIIAIATTDVAPLATVAPWVDPALAAIVDRGLARDPDARWQGAEELLSALAPLAGETPLCEELLPGDRAVTPLSMGARSISGGTAVSGIEPPRRRRAPLIVGGLAALGVGMAVAVMLNRAPVDHAPTMQAVETSLAAPSTTPPPAPEPVPPASSPAASSTVKAPTPRVLPGPRPPPKPSSAEVPPTPTPPPKLELKKEW